MILSQPQIREIISAKRPQFLQAADTYSSKMRMHMNGVDIKNSISSITGFERPNVHELRLKYTKSNKDLFSRLSRPLDRVFSAKGGNISYNLPDEQEKRTVSLTNNLVSGITLKKWLEMVWMPHMNDDPNGVIFMEILPEKEAILAMQRGKSVTYPTYKSSASIHNYSISGNRLEWIVFNVGEQEKKMAGMAEKSPVYRVVDDAFDYYVKLENEQVKILSDWSYPNFFGEVPAILNSDIVNPEDENSRLSFFDKAVELADDYFLKGSIKKTHDFLHGFPKYVEFADDCGSCGGSGFKESEKCGDCQGTGKKPMVRVSDIKLMQWPGENDKVILPTEAGGYIEPSKTYHEMANNDLLDLENAMNITIWGAESVRKKIGVGSGATDVEKTATQVVSEIRPEADRLHVVSEMAELRHKFILDAVVRINVYNNYGGANVKYGRRYMLESTDAIWMRYMEARQKGAPDIVLDDMLNEYYDARFMSDDVARTIAKKLMYVEPFVHLSIEQLQGLQPAEEDYKAKLYFSEWLSTMPDPYLLTYSIDELKQALIGFTSSKQLPLPVNVNPVDRLLN